MKKMTFKKSGFWTLIVAFIVCKVVSGTFFLPNELRTEPSDDEVLLKWMQMGPNLQSVAKRLAEYLMPKLNRTVFITGIGLKCHKSLIKMLTDLSDLKLWSVQMLDSTGFHIGGMVFDTWTSYGAYDQCLKVTDYSTEDVIEGQYCLVDFRPAMPKTKKYAIRPEVLPALQNFHPEYEVVRKMKEISWELRERAFRIGVCLPSACDRHDMDSLMNGIAREISFVALIKSCEVAEPWTITNHQKAIITVFATWIFVTIICGVAKRYLNSSQGWMNALAIDSNFTKALSLEGVEDPVTSHIAGIKVIAIVWIMALHQLLVAFQSYSVANIGQVRLFSDSLQLQLGSNGLISVDIFFFITGFLCAYKKSISLQRYGQGFKHEIVVPFIKRALRVLSMGLLIIGVTMILPLTGSGPIWKATLGRIGDKCAENWWTIFFFASNFVKIEDACAVQTWYLCADIQLFTLFLIYCFINKRTEGVARCFLLTLLAFSIVLFTTETYLHNEPPFLVTKNFDSRRIIDMMNRTHQGTHWHVPAYVIGIIMGTWVPRLKAVVIGTKSKLTGWTYYLLATNSTIFVSYLWNKTPSPGLTANIVYTILSRLGFPLALAWVSCACSTGNGGIVNRFLSWKGFQWYSQLIFTVFLTNLPVIYHIYGSTNVLFGMKYTMLMGCLIQIISITSVVSFLLNVLFERPLTEIIRLAYGGRVKSQEPSVGDNLQGKTKLKLKSHCQSEIMYSSNVKKSK